MGGRNNIWATSIGGLNTVLPFFLTGSWIVVENPPNCLLGTMNSYLVIGTTSPLYFAPEIGLYPTHEHLQSQPMWILSLIYQTVSIEIPPDFYAEHYNQRLNEQALESRLSCIGLFSICKNIPFTIQMLSHLRYPFWPIVVNIIQRFIIPLTWK